MVVRLQPKKVKVQVFERSEPSTQLTAQRAKETGLRLPSGSLCSDIFVKELDCLFKLSWVKDPLAHLEKQSTMESLDLTTPRRAMSFGGLSEAGFVP